MHYLSQKERRWIREGIEAVKKLTSVCALSMPQEGGDGESEEFLKLAAEMEDAALLIENMIDWEDA